MVLRVLAVLLGALFIALPFAPDAPKQAWLAALLGVVFLVYGAHGPAFPAKLGLRSFDPQRIPASGLSLPWYTHFITNCRIATRSGAFMIFAVLAGTAVAWWYQFQFDVPRERQTDVFPKILAINVTVLIIVRAAVVTVVQRRRGR